MLINSLHLKINVHLVVLFLHVLFLFGVLRCKIITILL
ncbi:hypothetical protein J5A57_09500 [Prevotella melaninogenica]|nr:hypothetical protein J5A57_09500 [Prevotella melaninogenica]